MIFTQKKVDFEFYALFQNLKESKNLQTITYSFFVLFKIWKQSKFLSSFVGLARSMLLERLLASFMRLTRFNAMIVFVSTARLKLLKKTKHAARDS